MKGSAIILSIFVGGMALAYYGFAPAVLLNENLSTWILYALMFMVGISLGIDKNAFSIIKSIDYKTAIVPVAVVVGSVLGSLIVSFAINGLGRNDVVAIGSSMGYYTLSSIFIGKVSGEEAGVVALLANMIRELATLTLVPLLARYFGKLAPVAAGGATTMDTSFPVIVKYSGKEVAVVALFSGIVLTTVVPFLLAFILGV